MVFPVWMLNCASPSEHGVAQYCVPAVLYVAQDEWITHGNLLNQLSFCFVYELVITFRGFITFLCRSSVEFLAGHF